MTRKEAFLLVLVALLGLAFVQHARWPDRFFEPPSFRRFKFEDLAVLKELLAPKEEPKAEVLVEEIGQTELEPAPVEKKKTEEKPSEKKKEAPKKPKAPKPKPAPSAVASEPPNDEPVPTARLPEESLDGLMRCYDFARKGEARKGTITVLFVQHPDGAIDQARIAKDTLQLPMVTDCVTRTFQNVHSGRPDGTTKTYACPIEFAPRDR